MILKILVLTIALGAITFSCSSTKQTTLQVDATDTTSVAIAFPGAEGFGKYTTGGRGGKVMVVSNLNDAGPGSFREAVEAKIPRIIMFSLSGTIHLESPLNIRGNVTIAGQSAPGDGICIADHPVVVKGDNVIIRYMRFRMGDKNQNKGMVNGSGHDDAFSANRIKNLIVDHCSMSWSNDEVCSVYNGDSTTLQWNLISEPLNYSYHFETGDKDFENHGYGGILGGRNMSFHHNLYAHCVSRTPRFDGIRNIAEEKVDFRNNVIYDWASNNVYGGEGGNYNIVNNYYRPGPSTKKSVESRIANPFRSDKISWGKWFINGNFIENSTAVSANNWLGVLMDKGTVADTVHAKSSTINNAEAITTQTAENAYTLILQHTGASFKRDTLDQRIINDVKNKIGRIIDVQGGYPHGTDYNLSKNAWPELNSKPTATDTDNDGMPDEWETKNKLNANNPGDASAYSLHKHYTNIEVYLNGLIKIK